MAGNGARRRAARRGRTRAHTDLVAPSRSRDRRAEVAEHLGNTPAVCRTSYIDPRVIDACMDGLTIAGAVRGIDLAAPFDLSVRERIERAVLYLLQGPASVAAA